MGNPVKSPGYGELREIDVNQRDYPGYINWRFKNDIHEILNLGEAGCSSASHSARWISSSLDSK